MAPCGKELARENFAIHCLYIMTFNPLRLALFKVSVPTRPANCREHMDVHLQKVLISTDMLGLNWFHRTLAFVFKWSTSCPKYWIFIEEFSGPWQWLVKFLTVSTGTNKTQRSWHWLLFHNCKAAPTIVWGTARVLKIQSFNYSFSPWDQHFAF